VFIAKQKQEKTIMVTLSHAVASAFLSPFELALRTRVVFGAGSLSRLGDVASDLGFRRTLLVADPGILAAGHVQPAADALRRAGIQVGFFHAFEASPDSRMVEEGRRAGAAFGADSLVALGGGSSLDCAKGINFLLAGGGAIGDYRGFGKAAGPMLPSIGIPTTAGTGSEAQSYAIITDATTHAKMACGDAKAAFRVAILDPSLTVSQPRAVTAAAGYDALSHAVEAYVTSRRTHASDLFARDAWRLLEGHYERVLLDPDDLEARGAMLVGAHEAGIAIEHSMLGATHACANALTARYGTTHAHAIAVMLPSVVRWNAGSVGTRYAELVAMAECRDTAGRFSDLVTGARVAGETLALEAGERLARRLEALARVGGLPTGLDAIGARREDIGALAADAATEWTGSFNPRPFDAAGARVLFEQAFES
jgi:alcohol dehydrogenase